jgi:hypothetical protein
VPGAAHHAARLFASFTRLRAYVLLQFPLRLSCVLGRTPIERHHLLAAARDVNNRSQSKNKRTPASAQHDHHRRAAGPNEVPRAAKARGIRPLAECSRRFGLVNSNVCTCRHHMLWLLENWGSVQAPDLPAPPPPPSLIGYIIRVRVAGVRRRSSNHDNIQKIHEGLNIRTQEEAPELGGALFECPVCVCVWVCLRVSVCRGWGCFESTTRSGSGVRPR